jgi:hypothetical protein
MIKSKAIDIIRTFTESEAGNFDIFLKSPFFNTNKNLIKLYNIISVNFAKLDSDKMTEEYLYSKVFQGKQYNYAIMKNLMSDLFGLCEKFIAGIPPEIKDPEIDDTFNFEDGLKKLDYYNRRSLDKLFFAQYKKLEKQMEYSVFSSEFYRNKSRLVEKLYKFYTRRSQYNGAAETLYPMSIYNTCFIISTLKQDVGGMEYLKSQINYTPKINLTEQFYNNFNSEKFLNNISGLDPVYYDHISLHIKLMKLYNEPENWENYKIMKKLIINNLDHYSNSEKWHLLSALFSFVLNAYIVKSSKDLLREMAIIRKIQLKNVKFNSDGLGPLQAGVFRNIVEVFIILGDNDYAEYFINNFVNELEADKRKSISSYSRALIEESRGNNEKVLELIRDVEFTDYQAKFSAKMVVLVAFYNLGYIEEGLSAIDSMKHFVKDTREFSEPAKINLTARVVALEKLFKITANHEKYSLADINALEELAALYHAARKEWFLSKTAELKKIVVK